MSFALALSLVAATLNLATAAAQWRFSRAPGWHRARLLAALALSAGTYNCLNLVFCTDGLAPTTYLGAARLAYLVAALHSIGWLVFAFGGPDGRVDAMPRWAQATAASFVALTALVSLTGIHLTDQVQVLDVPFAGSRYHYGVATPAGEVFGTLLVGLLIVPFVALIRRALRGDAALWLQVAGFATFFACAVVEVLVANRVLVFVSLLDVGFLAIILPIGFSFERRFLEDASRLAVLSRHLAEEVKQRTEERDRAREALAEAERVAMVGRLAAGVGHEITNPLAYLQLALAELQALLASGPEAAQEPMRHALDGAGRIERVVTELRTYARGLAPGADTPAPTPPAPPVVLPAGKRVLLIDDEPLVRQWLARGLARSWEVSVASSGADALAILETQTVDAIVCDLMMPGMSGVEVATHVADRFPELRPRMVFLTGGAATGETEQFLARADVRALLKPVSLTDLSAALTAAASIRPSG